MHGADVRIVESVFVIECPYVRVRVKTIDDFLLTTDETKEIVAATSGVRGDGWHHYGQELEGEHADAEDDRQATGEVFALESASVKSHLADDARGEA